MIDMSFTGEIQEELLRLPIKKTCCRKAMLLGLLFAARRDGEGWVIYCYEPRIAELAESMLQRIFHATTELDCRMRVGKKTYVLRFVSATVSSLLEELDGARREERLSALVGFRCASCEAHFMRGVFLGTASVSDPSKGYHMEMLFPSKGRADAIAELLSDAVGAPSRTHRGERYGVCYKNNGAISDLLYLLGCAQTSFAVTNASIEREIRNDENRATNCVTRNILRSVDAAQKQCAAIETLIGTGRLGALSEELQMTARLRVEHPDASLAELALMHTPPLTKSGLNRRLAKLIALAEEKKSEISS